MSTNPAIDSAPEGGNSQTGTGMDRAAIDRELKAIIADVLGIDAGQAAAMGADSGLFGHLPELDSMAVAGLLVGVGTTIGGGCTSGHGVCGLARVKARSLAAVLTFMGAGFVTVLVIRHVL